ncbi:MAG: glutamine amidotransferase [Bacteroidia bacterium]
MKKVLILQMRPEEQAADSEFEAFLRIGELTRDETERFRLEQEKEFAVDLNSYSAIIAGGSPFDVSCPSHKKSATQKRIESFYDQLFDQVIEQDFPFLGACSGNGLLGNYCGVPISNRYSEPVGSVSVFKTADGYHDPLLSDLKNDFLAFVGHKEACDYVPQEATLLLSSKDCPVQMFRIKNNIYATQFHPEADANEIMVRIRTYANFGYFNPDKSDELIASVQDVETPEANEILRRFIKVYHHNHS